MTQSTGKAPAPTRIARASGTVERPSNAGDPQLIDTIELQQNARLSASLLDLTSELSRSLTMDEIAQVVTQRAHQVMGAAASVFFVVSPDEKTLRLAASDGLDPAAKRKWAQLTPEARVPLADALRARKALWFNSREELLREYPGVAQSSVPEQAVHAAAALPLCSEQRTLGALAFSFGARGPIETWERDFLLTVAGQCVAALDRARLFEAEVRARRKAEEREAKLRLLAEAGAVLSSSLDYQTTLDQLAAMIVPRLADWCFIDVLAADGNLRRVSVQHSDQNKIALANELHKRYPVDLSSLHGVPDVLRTGQAEWHADIRDQRLVEGARDAEHLRIVRELGLGSYIVVPLKARATVLGALTLVHAESGRSYSEADLHFAEELARRAAMAIDSALLYGQVEQRERELRQLAETMPQLVWTARPDGSIDYCNQNWIDYTGMDLTQPGNARGSVFHPDDLEAGNSRWLQSVRTGEPYEAVYRFRRAKDGVYRWFIGRASPLRDESGRIVKWFGTCTDIDDQRKAESELKAYSEMLETINRVGTVLAAELDLEKLVQAVTDAATLLCGAEMGSFFYNGTDERGDSYYLYALSGVPRAMFESLAMPSKTALFAPTFEGKGVVRLDDVTLDPRYGKNPYHGMPKGHPVVRSYLAVPVLSRSGKVMGGLFFGHARAGVFGERAETLVSGLAAQAAIAMDNANLFRDAQRLIAALERSNAELDHFAHVASHDLKAPLRGISNLCQWLEDELGPKLEEGEPKRYLLLLRSRISRMEALIDGILSYSRAGRSQSGPELVDVKQLVQETSELLAPRPPATLEVAPSLPVLVTERVPLQQVLMNLIGNALKHAKRPDVTVRIEARETADAWVFSVIDNGAGIDPEFHARIWDMFQTLEPRDKVEGTGIGLAVVKKIVEGRGGSAWVDSERGQGAKFVFTWPKR